MSVNLPTHYARQFANSIDLLLQARGGRLRGSVTSKMYQGQDGSPVDQVGAVEMSEVTERFGAMPRTDAPTARRWIGPRWFDLNQQIDYKDLKQVANDPQSALVQSGALAVGRQQDRLIIPAFFANARTGVEGAGAAATFGTGLTAANAGNNVAVAHGASAATGLTVAKLREAKRKLMANHVDLEAEQAYVAITSEQHDDLLGEIQITSLDFNSQPVMQEGLVQRFLGFQFIHTELLETGTDDASGTSRQVPVWVKSGMHLASWEEPQTEVDRRPDIRGIPTQIYMKMGMNATRLEEGKVLRIWCRE